MKLLLVLTLLIAAAVVATEAVPDTSSDWGPVGWRTAGGGGWRRVLDMLFRCRHGFCGKRCKYGRKVVDGCQVCACNDPCKNYECKKGYNCEVQKPCPACDYRAECVLDCPPRCRMYCPYGKVTRGGCEQCECIEPCATMLCEQGTCEVKKDCDPAGNCEFIGVCTEDCPPRCRMYCPYGKVMRDGCEQCECIEPCAKMRCEQGTCEVRKDCDAAGNCEFIGVCTEDEGLVCPYLASDTIGTCDEACEPGRCAEGEMCCSHGCGHSCTKACERITCNTFVACDFGLEIDENGCQVCACAEDPCETRDFPCQDGYKCKGTQRCNNDEICAFEAICVEDCPECRNKCEFGYTKQENGCQSCECAHTPCATVRCRSGTKCEVQKSCSSSLISSCTFSAACVPDDLEGLVCPYLASDTIGTCDEACEPGGCAEGEMCCSHGCGHSCAKACERITCNTFVACDFGLEIDKYGCQVCACAEDPCKTRDFPCRGGYKCKATQRCNNDEICAFEASCVEVEVRCPPKCPMDCPYGKVVRDGCEQCECIQPCATMLCEQGTCEVKKDCDAAGNCEFIGVCTGSVELTCPVSEGMPFQCEEYTDTCSEAGCSNGQVCCSRDCGMSCVRGCKPICEMLCTHGFKVVDGCEVCECNKPCQDVRCNEGEICQVQQVCPMDVRCRWVGQCVEDCPKISCPTKCEYGFAKKDNGCRFCECKENPCNVVDCKGGYKCEAQAICDEDNVCDYEAECVIDCLQLPCGAPCEYGFASGDNGCPNCECLPDPCIATTCLTGYQCVVTGGQTCGLDGSDCRPATECVPT